MHRLLVYRTELEGSVAALVNPVLEWSSKDKETLRGGLPVAARRRRRGRAAGARARPRAGRARQADPGRGLGPGGARDPARDGPPRRRPDPRPHLARPAQAGHAHAARALDAAHRPRLEERLPRHDGVRGGRAAPPGRLRAPPAARRSRAPTRKQGRGQKLARRRSRCSRASSGSRSSSPRTCTRRTCWSGSPPPSPRSSTTCAYGVLIKEPLLSDYEMINVHPSLLPRWRGAAPIERAIMAGDAETGVRDHARHRRLGLRRRLRARHRADPRPTTTTARSPRGSRRSAPTCWSRRSTSARTPVEQDESLVTYAHKIGPRERALDPTQTPEEVERTIRALRPHIGSRLPLPDGTFLGVIAAARRRPDPRARRRPRAHARATGCCSTATAARSS